MGLFPAYNQTATITNPVDSSGDDMITYPSSTTREWHIIRQSVTEQSVLGEEISTHEVNDDGDVTSTISKSAKVIWDSKEFKIVNRPEYLPLIKKTKILLIQIR